MQNDVVKNLAKRIMQNDVVKNLAKRIIQNDAVKNLARKNEKRIIQNDVVKNLAKKNQKMIIQKVFVGKQLLCKMCMGKALVMTTFKVVLSPNLQSTAQN